MDNSEFIDLFLSETKNHLSSIESHLLEIEQGKIGEKSIDSLFRHYHTIKGMCASMGYKKMQNFSHLQEDLLEVVRENSLVPSKKHCLTLIECLDLLKTMTNLIEKEGEEKSSDFENLATENLAGKLENHTKTLKESLKNSGANQNNQIKQTPEIKQAKLQSKPKVQNFLRVEGSIFDNMLVSAGDLFAVLSTLKKLTYRERSVELKQVHHKFKKALNSLYNEILFARMLPFSTVTNNLPRIVRDIATEREKNVNITIEGSDIKLDKAVIEKIADPLIHIIRNAVDHGIETPIERANAGKPPSGTITIKTYNKGQNVITEITDDGKGLDPSKIKEKALERGFTKEALGQMTDKEIIMLICSPGFSLAKEITQISGRGVGMDIVKETIDELNGAITITSIKGIGTKFIIDLPRIVSITDVVVIRSANELFSIPKTRIEKIIEVKTDSLTNDSVNYDGREIKLQKLSTLLNIADNTISPYSTIILLNNKTATTDSTDDIDEKNIFGIVTGGIDREMEAYIRPLSEPMNRLKLLSGVSILGDDRPVFLLDISELSKLGQSHA